MQYKYDLDYEFEVKEEFKVYDEVGNEYIVPKTAKGIVTVCGHKYGDNYNHYEFLFEWENDEINTTLYENEVDKLLDLIN